MLKKFLLISCACLSGGYSLGSKSSATAAASSSGTTTTNIHEDASKDERTLKERLEEVSERREHLSWWEHDNQRKIDTLSLARDMQKFEINKLQDALKEANNQNQKDELKQRIADTTLAQARLEEDLREAKEETAKIENTRAEVERLSAELEAERQTSDTRNANKDERTLKERLEEVSERREHLYAWEHENQRKIDTLSLARDMQKFEINKLQDALKEANNQNQKDELKQRIADTTFAQARLEEDLREAKEETAKIANTRTEVERLSAELEIERQASETAQSKAPKAKAAEDKAAAQEAQKRTGKAQTTQRRAWR